MNKWIELPEYCCLLDLTIIEPGSENCRHELGKKEDKDVCVHFTCSKCGRELCYGVFE